MYFNPSIIFHTGISAFHIPKESTISWNAAVDVIIEAIDNTITIDGVIVVACFKLLASTDTISIILVNVKATSIVRINKTIYSEIEYVSVVAKSIVREICGSEKINPINALIALIIEIM